MAKELFAFLVFVLVSTCVGWDYTFEGIENMNDTGEIVFDFRIKHLGRSKCALSGNMTFRSSFTRNPNKYYHTTNFYISPLGNNQYSKLPVRFPKELHCVFINDSYRKYFMNSMKQPVSNLPYSDDPESDLCNAFQSDGDLVFWVNNYVIDKSVVPTHLPSGLIKAVNIIETDAGEIVGGLTILVRIETDPN